MLTLPLSFYQRDPIIVAKELLGKILNRRAKNINLNGFIIETEAYLSANDAAAHSSRGFTKATAMLYEEAGTTYIHQLHRKFLLDITTEGKNIPSGVLIRAIKPLDGIQIMLQNRPVLEIENLANGPGKLCQALAINMMQSGIQVFNPHNEIFITEGYPVKTEQISSSPRVGITKAVDKLYNFKVRSDFFSEYFSRF